ncbi:hypothetical protein R1sor_006346 [Riccia sorocarpa]|uniref:Uncharacterized protein n=1 Tax=Riccia sorocarpa TaxID=122646 RepID=A0ABD3HR04_9MARC
MIGTPSSTPSSEPIVGTRLPLIRLMEAEFSSQYASAGHTFLTKLATFVPYSFKDLADVDLVEFSAMTSMKMLKYVTGIQRWCVPEDIFLYAFWNTNVDGNRLLIKGCSGSTCVVGSHEVLVAFGASHADSEEFRAIKINNKNMAPYRPGEYLPESVETNAQRKLVNGRPYEEISYYKEAAPYGPTYFLMTVIAELFWCNGRTTRFTTPMLYVYMRSVHGHHTNWSKDDLPTRVSPDVVLSPNDARFVRTRITSKKPKVSDAQDCPGTSSRPPTNGVIIIAEPSTPAPPPVVEVEDPRFRDFGQKLGVTLASVVSRELTVSFGTVFSKANPATSLRRQVDDLTLKLGELERVRHGLNDRVSELKAELDKSAEKSVVEAARKSAVDLQKEVDRVAKEAEVTIAGLQTELKIAKEDVQSRAVEQDHLKASVRSLTGRIQVLKDEAATNEANLRKENADLQHEIQTHISQTDTYKKEFHVEMTKAADLEEQLNVVKNQVEDHKFTAERAEKAHTALRLEFNQIKTELRMLKVSGK